jgi:subtilisin family serine protease
VQQKRKVRLERLGTRILRRRAVNETYLITRISLVALALAGATCLALSTPVAATGPPPHAHSEKIGADVLETLRAEGKAHVVIALVPPAAAKRAKPDLRSLRRELRGMQEEVLARVHPSGFAAKHKYRAIPAMAGRVLTEAGLAKLAAHPHVTRIDLDVGASVVLDRSVPLIGADLRHTLGNAGAGVVAAVIDTGIDTDHDDLFDSLVWEECFLDFDGEIDGVGRCPNGSDRQSGPGAAEDDDSHGTHVSGIISSNGVVAPVGVAPGAGIVAIKVFDATGHAEFGSEILAALDFVINNPQLEVQLVNMSFEFYRSFPGECDDGGAFRMAFASAINTLRANGVTAFAAAGNSGFKTEMRAPACLSNVVSVGASNDADEAASFTNSNPSTDIFAPGVRVLSSIRGNRRANGYGTSMSTPHAVGCAALLIESGEAVTPDQIEARLKLSPTHVLDPKNGLSFSRIDCSPFVSALWNETLDGPDTHLEIPTSLRFVVLNASCDSGGALEFFLNGGTLGTASSSTGCRCRNPSQVFQVTDAALIASLWNAGGVNEFRVIRSGPNDRFGWVRVNYNGDSLCIFDLYGGECKETNICDAGYTVDPVDVTAAVGPGDGSIDKAVEVGQPESTVYEFTVNYGSTESVPVLVKDTVPAEWDVELVEDDGGRATAAPADGGGSATKIHWEPGVEGGTITIRAESRWRPSNRFAPTSCGNIFLNDGARAIELDPVTRLPLQDELGEALPALAESNPLCLAAVPDLNGDGKFSPDGSGDEDGDGLTDLDEACVLNTDPCIADTDGDGVPDGEDEDSFVSGTLSSGQGSGPETSLGSKGRRRR